MVVNALQEATLLSAKERNSLYYIDYSLKKPGEEDPRIFQTAVALGFNGTWALFMIPHCLSIR